MEEYGDGMIQKECDEDFKTWCTNVQKLNDRLDTYMKAIRPFGSSSGLIKASLELPNGFGNVLQAFEASDEIRRDFFSKTGSIGFLINSANLSVETASARSPLVLADHMESLSALLSDFLKGFSEIPEFSDKPLADALVELRALLSCRAERIKSHATCPLVQNSTTHLYIGQVMKELSFHTAKMIGALEDFVTNGLITLKNAQEKSQTWLQNMATVATFFSGVTVATMQYTVQRNGLGTVVLGLWISSLILSIASVVNSQLAIFLRAAIYRSPRSTLPTGITLSPQEAPLFYLTGAVLAFSVGLVIWTIASDFALPVRICAVVVTCTTYSAIFIVVIWVIKDWWTPSLTERTIVRSSRNDAGSWMARGRRNFPWRDWRRDTMAEIQVEDQSWVFVEPPLTTVAKLLVAWHRLIYLTTGLPFPPIAANTTQRSADALPIVAGLGTRSHAAEASVANIGMTPGLSDTQFQLDDLKKLQPLHRLPIFHPAGYDIHFSPDGKYLGVGCVERAVAIWRVGSVYGKPELVLDSPTGRFGWSPDGSYVLLIAREGLSILETGSWRPHCLRKFTAPISSVAWLQSSGAFVLAIDTVLEVFDTRLQLRTPYAPIRLPIEAHDIASIPNFSKGKYGFILILGSLCDNTAQKSPEAIGPDMRFDEPNIVFPEHWLMVIDLDAPGGGRSVAEAPTLADARHICVSQDGRHAIVSYTDSACPELWKLRDDSGNMQLSFCRRFTSPDLETLGRNRYSSPATSGKARFCGISDDWVLATDGRSTIYIWDRVSGFLIHTLNESQIRAQFGNDSGIIAATSSVKRSQNASLIVVSACNRGGVIVWESPNEGEAQAEPASEGETSQAGATHSNPLQSQPGSNYTNVPSSSNCS